MLDTQPSTARLLPEEAPDHVVAPAPPARSHPGAAVVDRVDRLNQRFAPTLLRVALAAVFVWFGALKLMGTSPVEGLLAATLPFIDADLSVPVLGGIEVLIGLVLAAGILPRLTLLVLTGHLAGTFLTFVTASELMWQDGHFLALTADGEFVAKNVVFISAALMLIGWYSRRAQERRTA